MKRWLVRFLVALAVAGVTAGAFLAWTRLQLTAPGPVPAQTTVVIPKGTNSRGIAELLREAGVIDRPWLFLLEVRVLSKRSLQAGEYSFVPHASLASVIDMIHRGEVVVHRFTVAEGLTVFQILAQLREAEGLAGKVGVPPSEGSLLPQTYFYSFGDSRDALLMRMNRAMSELIDDAWPKRAPNLPLSSKAQVLALASIVERETAISEERPRVAAVFLNRLRQHMKLQSDPTVIYALSQGEGGLDHPLDRQDLAVASPYNTYAVDGLPPGPICNPGRASVEAVLHPAATDDLYFVADGSGGHVFAKTLAEHNRNVAHLRLTEQGATPAPAKKTKSAQ
jgi:UPF0755 protein